MNILCVDFYSAIGVFKMKSESSKIVMLKMFQKLVYQKPSFLCDLVKCYSDVVIKQDVLSFQWI